MLAHHGRRGRRGALGVRGHLVLNHLGQAAGKLITLLTERQI
jgi:hypothetical protein